MIRKLFPLWGAEDADDGQEGSGEEGSPLEPETKTVTAEELESMTARAADRATRRAKKDLASSLGFDSVADMTEFISTSKKAADESADEQTKALQEAERTTKENAAKSLSLQEKSLGLEIKSHVLGAGVFDPKKAARVAALVKDDLDADILEDEEGWEEAITDALQSVQADMPELFKAPGVGSGDGGAHGDSADDADKEAAAKEKQLREGYVAKGMVPAP